MSEAKEFFNRCAASWDEASVCDPEKIRAMILLSDIQPHSVIIDVGCGTGVLEPYLLLHNPAVILAVDYAENMIAVAKQKLIHPAVKFVAADIMDIADLQADNCFIFNTFGHFSEPETVVAHIAELLKPGGRITISHTQGKQTSLGEDRSRMNNPPCEYLQKILAPLYYVDTAIDNNSMLMISAVKR